MSYSSEYRAEALRITDKTHGPRQWAWVGQASRKTIPERSGGAILCKAELGFEMNRVWLIFGFA